MSIKFIEGWDVFQGLGAAVDANFVRRWTIPDVLCAPSYAMEFVAGRNGGQALRHNGGFSGNESTRIRTAKISNADRYITVGFAFRKNTADPSIGYFPVFLDTSLVPQGFLQFGDGTGDETVFTIRKGDPAGSPTLLGIYSVDLGTDWHYIEVEVCLSTSTALGYANLYIDGSLVLAISGVATAINDNGCSYVHFGPFTAGDGTADFDDMYIATSTNTPTGFQGDAVVEESLPTSDGSIMQGTAVGAANEYQCVDDPTNPSDEDTTYVQIDGVNKVALYGFPATTDYEQSVIAVEVEEIVRTSAGVNVFHAAEVYRSGDQGTSTPTTTVPGTYTRVSNIMEVDPITGAAWTVDDINASEFGVKQT